MEEKNDDSDYEYEDEHVDNKDNKEIYKDIIIDNVKILGEKIKLIFEKDKCVEIEIGLNNNFYDAVIKYGAKSKISISKIKNNYKFLFNARVCDIENKQTLKEIGFKNGYRIFVFDHTEIIGA